MWRAMVLAAGLCMCLLGAEFMVVDRVVIAESPLKRPDAYQLYDSTYQMPDSMYGTSLDVGRKRTVVTPEWAPWGFLSAGVLTVLYGSALPKN